MQVKRLLRDSFDLHVHTGPDVIKRKLSDVEMIKRIKKVGMKGYAIKSHYFCTADRAKLMSELERDLHIIGSITLNNTVNGFNSFTVEMAAKSGAKIVWMPTVDSKNEENYIRKGGYNKILPGWANMKEYLNKGIIEETALTIFDGKVISNKVVEVLKVIKKYNLILATGHLGKEEIFALVKKAGEMGIKKIVVTHPDFPSISLTKEEQKELSLLGAYMEHCFTTPFSGKMSWETLYENIKYVGSQNCLLSSDLGQVNTIYPDEGMEQFVRNLLRNGFVEDEIIQMIRINPSYLLN